MLRTDHRHEKFEAVRHEREICRHERNISDRVRSGVFLTTR